MSDLLRQVIHVALVLLGLWVIHDVARLVMMPY